MSGAIKLEKPLDREMYSQYALTILARDHGVPPSNATARVEITVEDANDNAPQFSQASQIHTQIRGQYLR